jgi:hypothetical protein
MECYKYVSKLVIGGLMMISCNNHQRVLARYPRYGLRKPGVGVASVLLSTSFWLGMTINVWVDVNPTPAGTQANSGVGCPQMISINR